MSSSITNEWRNLPGPAEVYEARLRDKVRVPGADDPGPILGALKRLMDKGQWDPVAAAALPRGQGAIELAKLISAELPGFDERLTAAKMVPLVLLLQQRRGPIHELGPWLAHFQAAKSVLHYEASQPRPDVLFLSWLSEELGALAETRDEVRAALRSILIGGEPLLAVGRHLTDLNGIEVSSAFRVPDVFHGLARSYRKAKPADVFAAGQNGAGGAEELEVSHRIFLEDRLKALESVLRAGGSNVFEEVKRTESEVRHHGLDRTYAARFLAKLAAAERYTGARFDGVSNRLTEVLRLVAVPPSED